MGLKTLRRHTEEIAYFALIMVFMVPLLFVFFWMISVSFRTNVEATASPPVLIPLHPTLDGYRYVLNNPSSPFLQYLLNSTIVAVGCTVLGMLLGVPAAFSIARWKQDRLAVSILLARITPGLSFLVPWFIVFRTLSLTDTHLALIISHLVVGLPVIVWVLIGFFEDLPSELMDAGMIDGCSIYGALWRIALPLVKPGLVATAILSVIFSWNNFVFSVILSGPHTRTLPVAVFNLMSFEQFNWGPLAAAATMITLPVMLMALVMQRHIVSGLTFGAVKQ
ncbi:MAG: carbohydrate ABC transporter permease [Chloroflexota bacterium]|nr:carbohydrate ABC transporter permease [Chloroflexota bacterium]